MPAKRITTSGGASWRPTPLAASTAWFLRTTLTSPGAWVLAGVALLFWVLQTTLVAIDLSSAKHYSPYTYNHAAFLSCLAAATLGLAILPRTRWTHGPLSRSERALSELASLATLTGLAVLATPSALPVGVHLASLAWLVSRLPTSPGLHPWLLVTLVLWIPALAEGHQALDPLVRFLLGPVTRLGQDIQTRTFAAVDMTPAVAFGLTAGLLTPRIPRGP